MNRSRVSPFTPAEETLGMSSAARGLQGMERTSAPKGPNLMDGGALSKPSLNAQPSNNARYEMQSVQQNASSAVPQTQANAVQQVRKGELVQDNAEYKANQFREARTAEVLTAMHAPATAALGSQTPLEAKKLRNDVATQKAMTMGVNPDLVQSQLG